MGVGGVARIYPVYSMRCITVYVYESLTWEPEDTPMSYEGVPHWKKVFPPSKGVQEEVFPQPLEFL